VGPLLSGGRLPPDCRDWTDALAHLRGYPDPCALERGFVNAAGAAPGPGVWCIDTASSGGAKCVDKSVPKPVECHARHGYAIWFWGNGELLTRKEKKL